VADIATNGLRFIPRSRGPLSQLKIHRSQVIFSAPWYTCETKTVKVEHESPIVVTAELLDKILKDEMEKFATETQDRARSKITQNLQVIEKRVISTRLNGYESSNPFGKKATRVELTFFVSLVSAHVLSAIQKVIDSHFHISQAEMSTFPLAAFTVFTGSLPKLKDFLIVDVRGEVTDLTLVQDGILMDNVSFSQSKNSLVRSVSDNLQQSFHGALSSLKIVLRNHGTAKFQDGIGKLIESFKTAWSDLYIKTIRDMLAEKGVPKTVFIIGDLELEILFENIFKSMKNVASIHLFKKSGLAKYVDVDSVSSDPFLVLETIFVNQLFH